MKTNSVIGLVLAGLALWVWGCKSPPPPPPPGEPLAGLTPAQRAQFNEGKQVFEREFEPADGLGPLFNNNSCAECHEAPVVGGFGEEIEVHATRFDPHGFCDPLFDQGGPVIQQDATPLLQAKGIAKEQIPSRATAQARRSSPPVFGFGLVEGIPDAAILSRARANRDNRYGIRGHPNYTIDGRVGRFGRKAAVATLFDFNAGAFPQEMGITTPLSPTEETINGTPIPPDTDPAPDPEIAVEDIEKVTAFVRFLAPPPKLILTNFADKYQAGRGQKLFARLQCEVCHVPEMRTGPSPIKSLDRKKVALYSDLLLHDMGPLLADICLGQAHPSDFRTEMLMGLRFRTNFLHNGSAPTIRRAIELHGGEARYSRDAFKNLDDTDQRALLKFLRTL